MEDSEEDSLEHYGTKGMKWGVRKKLAKMPAGERGAFLKNKDAKWLEKVEANPKLSKVSRIAARDAKKMTKKLKQDYKRRGMNIKKDRLAMTRYDAELRDILTMALDRASYKVHKTSPSRLNEVEMHRHPDGTITAMVVARKNAKIVKQFGKIAKSDEKRASAEKKATAKAANAAKKSISHADDVDVNDEDFVGLGFLMTTDEEGFVDDIQTPFDSIEHGESDIEAYFASDEDLDALMHYGIKGMKWGVRRRDRAPTNVEVLTQPGRRVKARGGENQPPSDDAVRAAIIRQKARKSTVHSLSNKEIQDLVNRLNLEQQYARTVPASITAKGLKFATKVAMKEAPGLILAQGGKYQTTNPKLAKAMNMLGENLGSSNGNGKKKKKD